MADENAANHRQRYYKLPDSWSASPAAWFGIVEAQFLIRGTETQRDKFALVTTVLPKASARRVAHILAAPGETCYDELKTALLAAHQLVHPGEERTRLFPCSSSAACHPLSASS